MATERTGDPFVTVDIVAAGGLILVVEWTDPLHAVKGRVKMPLDPRDERVVVEVETDDGCRSVSQDDPGSWLRRLHIDGLTGVVWKIQRETSRATMTLVAP